MIRFRNMTTGEQLSRICGVLMTIMLFLGTGLIDVHNTNNELSQEIEQANTRIEVLSEELEKEKHESFALREKLNYQIEMNTELLNENTNQRIDIEELEKERDDFTSGLMYDLSDDRVFTSHCFDMEAINVLYRTVESEATEGTIEQKMNVCRVILNRVDSSKFPNSIREVVFQPKQFSVISDKRYFSVSITESTEEAVRRVLNGENMHNALYFMNPAIAEKNNAKWFRDKLQLSFEDGIHSFFVEK